jgi:hypothetical protein
MINNCQEIYDMKTPEEKIRRVNDKILNPIDWKLMPKEIAILGQRLPKGSVASKSTQDKVMNNMRRILNRE